MDRLIRLERRLDSALTRAFARLFRSPVDPVEIAAALRRECDDKAAPIRGGRTLAPNEFVVEISPLDSERINGPEVRRSLAYALDTYASERSYSFAGPVTISFQPNPQIEVGLFALRSTALAAAASQSAHEGEHWLEVGTRKVPLGTQIFRIGRDDSMDLRLEDPGVSRHHCDIEINSGVISVHDQGSTNGTLINGVAITRAIVANGSVIRVGSTDLIVRGQG